MRRALYLFFLTLLVHVQAKQPTYSTVEDLSTISCVDRNVGKIILENGLQVYLISDPCVKQSAAAMAVEVGFWNDPKEYPGMAHFLEHLLFLGSKAYPQEFEYMQFIADHEGKNNALTLSDKTIYAFSINTDAYSQALDRFSHFFIDPLFSCDSINQELHVVDQEYAENIEDDCRRLLAVLKETGNPLHPNRYSSLGNKETLSKIPQTAVQDWYAKNYGANHMHLVMISSLPVTKMKNLAEKYFSAINNVENLAEVYKGSLFSTQQKGSIIFIKPIKDLKELHLKWEIPQEFSNLGDKLPEFLTWILQKQVKGSLFAKLKDENLIEELSVFKTCLSKENQLFSIKLSLTEHGLLKKELVISYVFAALERLKLELPEYLFEEFKSIKTIKYKKGSLDPIFNSVLYYSLISIYEDLSSYPEKTMVPSVFNFQKFQSFLQALTPSDCAYFVIANPSKIGVVLDRKEKWMQAEYAIVPVDLTNLRTWENMSTNPEITVPKANPFLSTCEDLPALIYQDEGCQMYFDRTYSDANALAFQCKTPFFDKTPKNQVLAALCECLLKDILADDWSFAADAGIHGSMNMDFANLNLNFTVWGHNENIFPLAKRMFCSLKQLNCSQEKFQGYVQFLTNQYENSFKELPMNQARNEIGNIFSGNPSIEQKLLALENITREEFCDFLENFMQCLYVKAFFYVGLSQTQALEQFHELQGILDAKPYPLNQHIRGTLISLCNSSKLILKTKQKGASTVLSLQQGPFSFESQAVQKILGNVLQTAFFDTIRTHAQIAYCTKVDSVQKGGRLFQFFSAQSSTNTADDLLERFELFLRNFDKNLQTEIPLERFEQIRASIITLIEKDIRLSNLEKNLQTRAFLAFCCQDFNWTKKLISNLYELSYERFCAVAHQMLSKEIPRLAVLVEGTVSTDKESVYQEFFSREDIINACLPSI